MSSPARIRIGGGVGSGSAKAKPKRPNPVRRIMNHEQRIRENSVASSLSTGITATAASSRQVCTNPHCDKSDVRDGHCQTCGRVVWESNIVAEVTFGETASGAAVVHGSYVAADQGGIRPTGGGLAFRRVAGAGASEARERSLREAKQLISQFAHQLHIHPHVADKAFQLYKFASTSNFIQGRRKTTVSAICMYAACRKEENNKVMLIDLADIIKTDVFLLGRSYKELLILLPDVREGTKPVIIEDLIFRFASKLEFLHDTNKVALSAIRIAQRMRHDNITHGRRPAGICGAALIMAARAHNYRRTVREVVYIAKVTMATLQERMEEFANVPSAQMTIREFHESNTLPETSHDPPFIYKQSKEWQEKHPKKTTKRKAPAGPQAASQTTNGSAQDSPAKRRKTSSTELDTPSTTANPAAEVEDAAAVTPAASSPPATPVDGPSAAVVDKDGFVVPPRPPPSAHDRAILGAATQDMDSQLEALADEFGDAEDEGSAEEEFDPNSEMAMAAAQGIVVPGVKIRIKPREEPSAAGNDSQGAANGNEPRKKKEKPTLPIDEEWELDESNLEKEMEGHLNDPRMIGASAVVARDIEQRREQQSAARAATSSAGEVNSTAGHNTYPALGSEAEPEASDPRFTPKSKVSDDPIVHEDEFKDDPEVMFCKLPEKDVKIKELIWANHNKDYMRKVQQKIFEAKMSQNGPQKPSRRARARKPRIGEGQTTPASSATEAAQNMLRIRAISTKLDYTRMGNLFEFSKRGPGSTYGGTNSVGSRSAIPSTVGSEAGSDSEDGAGGNGQSPTRPGGTAAANAPTPTQRAAMALAPLDDEEEEDEGAEAFGDDFRVEEAFHDEGNGEEDFDPFGDSNMGGEYEE